MKKWSKTENGFTLIEVLVSLTIFVIFVSFAADMLINSRMLASYAKHKAQAAYAAQQIIETERQAGLGFINKSKSLGSFSVVLDTKGNYSNTSCAAGSTAFCGQATITVAPSVYTSLSGVKNTSTTTDHFEITIQWVEQFIKLQVPMSETYDEDIANDPMLN